MRSRNSKVVAKFFSYGWKPLATEKNINTCETLISNQLFGIGEAVAMPQNSL